MSVVPHRTAHVVRRERVGVGVRATGEDGLADVVVRLRDVQSMRVKIGDIGTSDFLIVGVVSGHGRAAVGGGGRYVGQQIGHVDAARRPGYHSQ